MESAGEIPIHAFSNFETNQKTLNNSKKQVGKLAKALIVAKLGIRLLNAGDDLAAIGAKAFIPDNQNKSQTAQMTPPSYPSELKALQTSGDGSAPPNEHAGFQVLRDGKGNPIARIPHS